MHWYNYIISIYTSSPVNQYSCNSPETTITGWQQRLMTTATMKWLPIAGHWLSTLQSLALNLNKTQTGWLGTPRRVLTACFDRQWCHTHLRQQSKVMVWSFVVPKVHHNRSCELHATVPSLCPHLHDTQYIITVCIALAHVEWMTTCIYSVVDPHCILALQTPWNACQQSCSQDLKQLIQYIYECVYTYSSDRLLVLHH